MKTSKHNRLNRTEKGTGHWRWQRVSALLLIPLSLWLVVSFSNVVYSEYEQSLVWASEPLVGSLLGLTLVSMLFHGHLGIVVVIDDYVRGPWRRRAIQISALFSAFTSLLVIVALLLLFTAK